MKIEAKARLQAASAVTAAMTVYEWRVKSGKLNEALEDADRALGTAESDLDEFEPDDDPAGYKKQQKLITQLKKKYEDAKQKVADHKAAGKGL